MEFLTAAVLSGIIYDGIKAGATLSGDFLKTKLKNWLVSDEQITEMLKRLKEAGINGDLGEHAIERKINQSEDLLNLLRSIPASTTEIKVSQSSEIGNNVYIQGNGNVTVGGITVNKRDNK
ncbi:GapS6a family protein [Planctobacterium marinum]|uniref:GapS6a family protein n=1 Tax=Planctobacterium marinum TaxID=1631968 RepID=UPI001E5F7DD1|nr:hypothetical protein [Planctobacterium marinum]MCC2606583.1 hypothetical protein [Planctobacterium marinum]